eukprot:maker-scaffold_20-snap-gene-3.40-mRNA-1 protein AED:0.12 eAED:0.00 QI:66/1/0.66/1/0.5/0.33/3/132/1068
MATVEINPDQFWGRVNRLYQSWNAVKSNKEHEEGSSESPWQAESWFFIVGKTDGVDTNNIGELLSQYLLSFLFTDTLFFFTENTLHILASKKKHQILQQLKKKTSVKPSVELNLILREKDDEGVLKQVKEILGSLKTTAHLLEDKFEGKFTPIFFKALEESEIETKEKSLKDEFVKYFSKHDSVCISLAQKASHLCTRSLKKACLKRMENIIDEELPLTLGNFAKEIADKMKNPKKLRSKAPATSVSLFFDPVVFSNLKTSENDKDVDVAASSEKKDSGSSCTVIGFEVGAKFKDYASAMARTYFVGPGKEEENVYGSLVKVYKECLRLLKPGIKVSDFVKQIKEIAKKEGLEKGFAPSLGENLNLIDRGFKLDEECGETISALMVFYLRLEVKRENFKCVLGDTVVVRGNKIPETNLHSDPLTKSEYNYDQVIYELQDDEEEEEEDDDEASVKKEKPKKKEKAEPEIPLEYRPGRVTRSQNKSAAEIEQEKSMASIQKQIEVHQKELMKKRAQEEMNKFESGAEPLEKEVDKIELKRKFATASKYPKQLDRTNRNQVYCDMDSECVFVPIFGYHVPFHITSIKSVSKSDEERATLLRLNFFYPTNSTLSKDASDEMRALIEKYPKLAYVKEMSFKSRETESANLNLQLRLIKELQKKVRARKKKKEQEQDIVPQQKLILNTRSGRKPRITDVSMRPPLRKGKCYGNLTAHVNGLRFRTSRGETFDILYSNIKHFIFQPNDHELTVLVHFHLVHPVIIGAKTKSRDVQFFAEVVEGSTALDAGNRRRHMYDIDEIDDEERERKMRKRLNKLFKHFCDQVVEVVEQSNLPSLEYDIPYRKLSFTGVPNKEMVLLQPTVNCLINVTETPFFLVSLDEVAHIHFERTDFRVSKTFDMVFILKKHLKLNKTVYDVPQRIQTIPVDKFEMIKQWIDEKGDLTFTCGTTPLNWKNVMIGVREELENGIFWDDVDTEGEKKAIGWNFLSLEEEEEVQEVEEEGSVFSEEGVEEESESEEDESEMDESESESEEVSEEEAPSWDDLHKEAEESDRRKKHNERSGHEEERRVKRRRR